MSTTMSKEQLSEALKEAEKIAGKLKMSYQVPISAIEADQGSRLLLRLVAEVREASGVKA